MMFTVYTFVPRCKTCGNYVYKGKKFNARKESAIGEEYLGIQIYRFYIRCPQCLSEITFKVGHLEIRMLSTSSFLSFS